MASTNKTPKLELSQFILQDKLKMDDYNTDMLNIDTKAMAKADYDPDGTVQGQGGILPAVRDVMEDAMEPVHEQISELVKSLPKFTPLWSGSAAEGQTITIPGIENFDDVDELICYQTNSWGGILVTKNLAGNAFSGGNGFPGGSGDATCCVHLSVGDGNTLTVVESHILIHGFSSNHGAKQVYPVTQIGIRGRI